MGRGLKVLALIGPNEPGLLGSYARACMAIGCDVTHWEPYAALRKHTKFGALGEYATRFIPVDAWIHKANRELLVRAAELRPDLVLIVANTPVRAGAIAQLRVIIPETRIVLVWPDTLLNLTHYVLESLPLYDIVATYSSASVAQFEKLGARRAQWFPFAADPVLFPPKLDISEEERRRFECDVCFIGGYNREREAAIAALLRAGLSTKVWGDPRSWKRQAGNKKLLGSYFQGVPLFGPDYAKAIRCAKLSLNLIDPTNYPAANMRFFESPACIGATLNSPCPEMIDIFRPGESAFYFNSVEDLPSVARDLVSNPALRNAVAARGHELVLREHTYAHRAEQLLRSLDLPVPSEADRIQ